MARIQTVALNFTAVNQFTPWLPHDYYGEPFNVSLAFYLGVGLAGTFAVQFALDDMSKASERLVFASQTTTVITVRDSGPPIGGTGGSLNQKGVQFLGHGLAAGDAVYLNSSPGGALDGDYLVASVVDANTYTLTSAVSQTIAVTGVNAISGRVSTHSTMTGMIARAVGNYNAPCYASRLVCTAFTSGGAGYLVAMQGGRAS